MTFSISETNRIFLKLITRLNLVVEKEQKPAKSSKILCGIHKLFLTFVKRKVVGGPGLNPVENVNAIFRTKVVDKTDEQGKLSFIIPNDVDRFTVTFQDPTDQYFDTTQTVPFQRG